MSYNVAEYVVGWLLCSLADCEKIADYSQYVFH